MSVRKLYGRDKNGKKILINIPSWDDFVIPIGLGDAGASENAPLADNVIVGSIIHGQGTDITLLGSDPDDSTLEYIIVSLPNNSGSLTDPNGTLISSVPYTLLDNGNIVEYSSSNSYVGAESFSYKVTDLSQDSDNATVSITVSNTTPITFNIDIGTVNAGTGSIIQLSGSDADGDTLSYIITSLPDNSGSLIDLGDSGSITFVPYTLSGSGDTVSYIPSASFSGTEIFTYKVNDGFIDSNISSGSANVI